MVYGNTMWSSWATGARAVVVVVGALGALAACGDRVPSVDEDNPRFGRFEAPDADNACTTDLDCVVGGCSGEVCAAEPLASTCEVVEPLPAGECGCVDGACQWWLPPDVALAAVAVDDDDQAASR